MANEKGHIPFDEKDLEAIRRTRERVTRLSGSFWATLVDEMGLAWSAEEFVYPLLFGIIRKNHGWKERRKIHRECPHLPHIVRHIDTCSTCKKLYAAFRKELDRRFSNYQQVIVDKK